MAVVPFKLPAQRLDRRPERFRDDRPCPTDGDARMTLLIDDRREVKRIVLGAAEFNLLAVSSRAAQSSSLTTKFAISPVQIIVVARISMGAFNDIWRNQ